jgi:cell division protein FtsB
LSTKVDGLFITPCPRLSNTFIFVEVQLREKILQHKFKIITLVFLVWMTFFDKNNFIDQYHLRAQYQSIVDERDYYVTQIEQAKKEREQLFTNSDALEKFAREKYHMKKDEEEVFIIVPEKTSPR